MWLDFPNPVAVADGKEGEAKKIKQAIYKARQQETQSTVSEERWQGKLIKNRWDDEKVNLKECFAWLSSIHGRIDATVIDKTSKQVRVIEMSCPWLENRESKDFEKTTKYSKLRLELTNRYPEYKVNQYNIIMDVLGGCWKEVEKNIKELVGDKCESIMRQMQKAILSNSLHIARMFKLSA